MTAATSNASDTHDEAALLDDEAARSERTADGDAADAQAMVALLAHEAHTLSKDDVTRALSRIAEVRIEESHARQRARELRREADRVRERERAAGKT